MTEEKNNTSVSPIPLTRLHGCLMTQQSCQEYFAKKKESDPKFDSEFCPTCLGHFGAHPPDNEALEACQMMLATLPNAVTLHGCTNLQSNLDNSGECSGCNLSMERHYVDHNTASRMLNKIALSHKRRFSVETSLGTKTYSMSNKGIVGKEFIPNSHTKPLFRKPGRVKLLTQTKITDKKQKSSPGIDKDTKPIKGEPEMADIGPAPALIPSTGESVFS